jgi:hypothetical protein
VRSELTSDETGPDDPMTELAAGASQTHELFMAYTNAGFSRDEALRILIGIITAPSKGA